MDNNLILIGLVIFSIALIYLLYLNFEKIKDISTLKDEISNIKSTLETQKNLQTSVTNNLLTKVGTLETMVTEGKSINDMWAEGQAKLNEVANEVLNTPPTEEEMAQMGMMIGGEDGEVNDDHEDEDDYDGEVNDHEDELELENIDDDLEDLDKDLDDAIDDLEREIEEHEVNDDSTATNIESSELEEELKTDLKNELGDIDITAPVPGDIDAFFPESTVETNDNLEEVDDDDVEEVITTNNIQPNEEEEEDVEEDTEEQDNDEVVNELSEENLKAHNEVNDKHNVIESIEQLESSSVNLDMLDNVEVEEDNDLEDIDMKRVGSKKYLTALTVRQLKAICKELDVKASGNKNDIVKRIVQHKKNEA